MSASEELKALTSAINALVQLQLKNQADKQIPTSANPTTSHSDLYNQLSARVEKYVFGSGDETKPFTKWLQRHEYTVVSEAASLPPEMQSRLVLDKLGQTEFDRLVNHVAPRIPSSMPQNELIETLKSLFRDKVPITRRRIEILNYRYNKSVPITEHIDRINRHASDFDRAKLTDDNLRVLLLLQSFCYSSENDELKKIALRVVEKNANASLKDIVAELEAHMNVSSSLKMLENPVSSSHTAVTNAVHAKYKNKVQRNGFAKKSATNIKSEGVCNGCGNAHQRSKCPFRDALCHKCSRKGHIAKVCRSESKVIKDTKDSKDTKDVKDTKDSKTVAKNASLTSQSITSVGKRRRKYVAASMFGKSIRLQYDSGSDITVINKNDWVRLGSPNLVAGEIVKHAGGSELKLIGKFTCDVQVRDHETTLDIHVSDCIGDNLFGLDAIDNLDLWSVPLSEYQDPGTAVCNQSSLALQSDSAALLTACSAYGISTAKPSDSGGDNRSVATSLNTYQNELSKSFPNLFSDELGTCRGHQVKFDLVDNAQAIQAPCRPIPYAMEKPLEEELQRLVTKGIIERAESSSWTTPIVIVKKHNGKMRLCADYSTGVNRALINNRHPLPNVENVMSKLNGNRVFSVLDLSDAFFQLEIAEDHREITTITTPKGLFRFKRLPFGIKTAPACFQQAMDDTLLGLEGVYAYIDDVIVSGSNRQEHDLRLRATLKRLEDKGWRLKLEKCSFALEEIKFLGLIVNAKGISADPETTRAIANMPKPTNVAETQSLLGMVNHYGKFIPHLHQIKQPLEDLTRKNRPWNWNRQHDLTMEQIKKIMLSPLLLEHFDPSKTLVVAADACSTGLGGVLLQRDSRGYERAVYHMSQSLSDTQRGYSQLEKEALALVSAVERFHKFLWGRRFILQTDHKPLVALLHTENTKGLKPTTAARLKRWAIRLLGYDFDIQFIRTEDFGQADALSRLIDKFRHDNSEEIQVAGITTIEEEVQQIRNLSIDTFGKNLRDKLKSSTNSDEDLVAVIGAIADGWKTTSNSDVVEHYKKRRDNLSTVDGTLLLGDRVVIPKTMQPEILTALHKGHPGIRRMKQLAREYVYWPKMADDIEHLVRQCDPCALTQKMPVKVPLSPWPTPNRPLERMHIDFAGPTDGQYLLLFVDAYSKFLDVAITPTISANRTVELCHEVFSRYGPPEVLVSDHGTQFTSDLFANLCKDLQITHLLTAVNHPQSNGQAERMVDIVKRAIAKDPSSWKKTLYEFLHSHRYTPCASAPGGKSPAELFFGRQINTPFSKLFPKLKEEETTPSDLAKKQADMEIQFTKQHGARQRHLSTGDRVIVLTRNKKREQGYILKALSEVRYVIRLDNGKDIERHINHIWKGGTNTPAHCQMEDDTWMYTDPNPELENPEAAIVPAAEESRTPPRTQGSDDRAHEEAPVVATPRRPIRIRAPPKRLVMDPNTKSYSER